MRAQSNFYLCFVGGAGAGDPVYASKLLDKCRRAGLLVTSKDDALNDVLGFNINQKVRAAHQKAGDRAEANESIVRC